MPFALWLLAKNKNYECSKKYKYYPKNLASKKLQSKRKFGNLQIE
jgi:hypothetical protein